MKLILLKNRRYILSLLLFFFFKLFIIGQDLVCEVEVPKSIEKIYLKAKNYKKYDYKNRVKYYKEDLRT